MEFLRNERVQTIIGIVLTVLVVLLRYQSFIPVEQFTWLEIIAFITYGWSTWLLAKNRPLGWWIGLIGVVGYIIIYWRVQLYGQVGIQTFYLITSFQAIYIWLRGGEKQSPKPVEHVPARFAYVTIPLVIVCTWLLQWLLIRIDGVLPLSDAIATVLSLAAQLYLMQRYSENWYIWIVADIIYIPLHISRGLVLTSLLYIGLLLMCVHGLLVFQGIINKRKNEKVSPAVA
jgi:nicotinamide mononucleotide transporter